MYVITSYKDIVLAVSEDLSYDNKGNPLINHGTSGILADLVQNIYKDVTDVPEDLEGNYYMFDGTSWHKETPIF